MTAAEIEGREAVVDRILSEVADAEDCGRLDLPPLFEAVDPDALEKLAAHDAPFQLSFTYCGYEVEFENPGGIEVTEAAETHVLENRV